MFLWTISPINLQIKYNTKCLKSIKKKPIINYYLLSIVTPDINISVTMTISLPNDPFVYIIKRKYIVSRLIIVKIHKLKCY
jgi:hypothetical protein